ncbi:serine-rich adhesin for platelets-like [Saccostrea echinata]|uniref:serine-rich adhesin for platelets-like n=1 Tax=Saccostrea echinata TaxID=191078 RepID=UPI002A7EE142|nr:serine-rich adhesin for platelets-like [Saccostrea echinata]
MATRKRGRPVGGGLTQSEIKERKRKSDRERNREKIFIGHHFQRWNRVKRELKFMYNHELAGYFLDRYEKDKYLQGLASTYSQSHRPEIVSHIQPISSSTKPLTDSYLRVNEQTSGLESSVQGKLRTSFNSTSLSSSKGTSLSSSSSMSLSSSKGTSLSSSKGTFLSSSKGMSLSSSKGMSLSSSNSMSLSSSKGMSLSSSNSMSLSSSKGMSLSSSNSMSLSSSKGMSLSSSNSTSL